MQKALVLIALALLLGGCASPVKLTKGDTLGSGWYARTSVAKF
jgi:uncharacterized protein YceK